MQLRRLELQAIGPFSGTELIDFDALGQSGLFLLEGPTGSGKSTIIDAIVFALYGSVAGGAESTNERLRSHHVGNNVESYVDLVFSLESGTYRVRRTPQFLKEGNKTPTAATAKLWRLSETALDLNELESAQVLATRARETGIEITRLIGLNRDQFVQTMVLPQGKFADFLRLDSASRTALLSKIFDMSSFGQIADWLRENARESQKRVAQAQQGFARAASNTATALGVETTARQELSETATGVVLPEEAKTVLAELETYTKSAQETADATAQAATQAEQVAAAATAKQREAETLAELLGRREKLLTRKAEFAAASPRMAKLSEQITQARKANRLATAARAARTWQENLETAQQEFRKHKLPTGFDLATALAQTDTAPTQTSTAPTQTDTAAVATGPENPATAALTSTNGTAPSAAAPTPAPTPPFYDPEQALAHRAQALAAGEKRLRELDELSGHLRELAATEASLHDSVAAQKRDEESLQALQTRAAALAAKAQQHETELAATTEEKHAQETAASAEPELATRVDKAMREHKLATETAELTKLLQNQEAQLADCVQASAAADKHSQEVSQRWRDSIAGELATQLVVGEPCQVCGSVEHPHPASPSPQGATRAEADAAAQVATQARAELAKAEAAQQNTRARITEKQAEIGELTPATAAATLQAAKEALATARQARQTAQTLATKITTLQANIADLQTETQSLAAQSSQLQGAMANRELSITAARQKIGGQLAGYESIHARQEATTQVRNSQKTWNQALQTVADTAHTAQQREAELAAELAASPFASGTEVLEHALEETELAKLETELENYRVETSEVTKALASPEIAQLAGQEAPDLAEIRQATQTAEAALRQARAQATSAANTHKQGSAEYARTQAQYDAWLSAREDAAPMLRLAGIANAGTESLTRIPLETYAVQRRFEQIVAVANERLLNISLGRYELVRTDEKERGTHQVKTGLGLEVIDHSATGDVVRSTRTLSGGETFYVSISLALGLADVVRAENGGIHLDTLLIDEGFGSLSEDALDQVMAVLNNLTDGGRAVGVVSHVSEMRSMIQNRLTVLPREDGSSTLKVYA
ncbi:SMC domain-containing protein [Actinobaculum suis]|uniref:Nuclease SbcCD subunit C n=1 Tax=Actinobaculum suis TaxID=1657 RepID=A0A7Z8YA59_9ACTO|nr:SMC family ATPase [Actinobaculum suis]VDG77090.1 SMC domain-containing protein [Actinobaculum suis]